MNKAVPWNLQDTASTGQVKADGAGPRLGHSVGDWLDALISDHAAEVARGKAGAGVAADRMVVAEAVSASAAPVFTAAYDESQELRATGTDGPLHGFAMGERRIVHVFDTADAGRAPNAGATPTPVARSDLRPSSVEVPPGTASDAKPAWGRVGGAKEQLIREAVAAITRRQAALEADLPPRPGQAQMPEAVSEGAGLGQIGKTLSTLEARLADVRTARAEAATRDQPSTGLDEVESQAFETLGQDLRRAVQTIDMQLRAGVTSPANMTDKAQTPLEDRVRTTQYLAPTVLSSEAPMAPTQPVQPAPDTTDRAEAIWADVKTLLDRFGSEASMDSLDHRMRDLASKVEKHLANPPSETLLEDLSRRIDALQSSFGPPASEAAGVKQVMQGIEDHIGTTRVARVDMQHLDDLMTSLARRIEESSQHPDARALVALETQIEKLSERLERSDANLSSLDAVEHSLRELFTQLEHTRYATIDAAENAARTAARDTLRAAMASPGVGATSEFQSDLADRLAKEVQTLKQQYDASEKRTHTALSSLNHAVETLVARLGHGDAASAMQGSGRALPSAPPLDVRLGADSPADTASLKAEPHEQWTSPTFGATDALIEPGDGRTAKRTPPVVADGPEIAGARSRSSSSVAAPLASDGSAPFIAAARRAAQAAQASAVAKQKPASARSAAANFSSASTAGSSGLALVARARTYLENRRRPMLLSLAGLVVLIGALEVAKVATESQVPAPDASKVAATTPSPASQPAPAVLKTPPSAPVPVAQVPATAKTDAANVAAEPLAPPKAGARSPEGEPAQGSAKVFSVPKPGNPFLAGLSPASDGLGEGLKALAMGGDPAAQYEVGLRYSEGRTVSRDPKMAAVWFEKAAAQGFAPAEYRLGSAYEKGIGEQRDAAMAMTWYGRAADAGNIRAMHNLAVMAAEGALGKPDYVKAATQFGKAASFGVRDSQFNLAILYARGLGIEQNLAQSYTWFAVAAAQGDDDAAKKRDEVAARLDAKTLDAAKGAADNFRALPSAKAANEVLPPPGGWDAIAPAATKAGSTPKV